MKPLIRPQKLGSTNTDDWIQYQLRKCSEEQKAQKPFKAKECRIYLTPQDEVNLRLGDIRKKIDEKDSPEAHKKYLAKIKEIKDKEMEDRMQRYIETGSYD